MAYKTYSWEGWKAHVAWAAAFMCKYSPSYCPAAEQWWNTARSSTLGTSFGYDWCVPCRAVQVNLLVLLLCWDSSRIGCCSKLWLWLLVAELICFDS
jgi:hypothetical protein